MITTRDRAQSFIEAPVHALGAFASDAPALTGSAATVGFLARKAALPPRVLLAVTDDGLHALEPGIGWRARRLVASWRLEEVHASLDSRTLVLAVPGYWSVRLAPLGEPARHVVERICA